MIETFYNVTCTNIRRTVATPTTSDTAATISSFIGVIRPIEDKAKLFVENNIGKEFDIVCDEDNNVLVNDDIYIGGVKYNTLGVTIYEDLEDDSDSYLNIRVVR